MYLAAQSASKSKNHADVSLRKDIVPAEPSCANLQVGLYWVIEMAVFCKPFVENVDVFQLIVPNKGRGGACINALQGWASSASIELGNGSLCDDCVVTQAETRHRTYRNSE